MDTTVPISEGSEPPKSAQETHKAPRDSKPADKLPERTKPPKAKKEKTPKPPKGPTPPKAKREPAAKLAPEDPDSMFKVGFLSEVYQERPVKPDGISKVVTRCVFLNYPL